MIYPAHGFRCITFRAFDCWASISQGSRRLFRSRVRPGRPERVGERLVYRGEENSFEFVEPGRSYAFDADGSLLRLASEAYRIRLAYLFDPYLAVSASQIEALPHQITAVYGEMLPPQPLRFLLADDPGAGKTIMAGLLIKELLIRGDLERCLIVAPEVSSSRGRTRCPRDSASASTF